MKPDKLIEDQGLEIIQRMGLYTALFHSTIQFNSIVFRVAVGVLSEEFLKAVALVTAIEFSLNWVLDVPGGILADRFGRIRCAVAGLTFLMMGLVAMYMAFFFRNQLEIALGLIVLDGVLLGIGKPLLTGSVEAFYQHALNRKCANVLNHPSLQKSFTLSQRFGRFIPPSVALAAFPIIYFLNRTNGAEHAFLIGIGLYILVIAHLIKDSRKFHFTEVAEAVSHPLSILRQFGSNALMRFTAFLNLIIFALSASILGYLLMSIGRAFLPSHSSTAWWAMAAFMMGFMTLGWVSSSIILPRLIGKISALKFIIIGIVPILLITAILYAGLNYFSNYGWIISLFIFGSVFAISINALRGITNNKLLSQVSRADYATALSIQNIPAFAWVGLHSFFVLFWTEGAPSLKATFQTVITICTITLIVLPLVRYYSKDLWKILTVTS